MTSLLLQSFQRQRNSQQRREKSLLVYHVTLGDPWCVYSDLVIWRTSLKWMMSSTSRRKRSMCHRIQHRISNILCRARFPTRGRTSEWKKRRKTIETNSTSSGSCVLESKLNFKNLNPITASMSASFSDHEQRAMFVDPGKLTLKPKFILT